MFYLPDGRRMTDELKFLALVFVATGTVAVSLLLIYKVIVAWDELDEDNHHE